MPEPVSSRMLAAVTIAVVGALVLVVVGALRAPLPAPVSTDQLGPDRDERVTDYLTRARDSLTGDDSEPRWALVSFTEPVTAQQIPSYSDGTRIGRVLYRVPIPRVQTALVSVPTPEGDAAAVASEAAAAWLLPQPLTERATAITTVSAARLRAGCACAVGLVMRGALPRLREIASHSDIRSVEALPADAKAGYFSVVPLLPEYTDVVRPGPDDGEVPAA